MSADLTIIDPGSRRTMPDLSLVELVAEAARLGIPVSALREAAASAAMAADEQGAYTLPPAPARIDSEGETDAR